MSISALRKSFARTSTHRRQSHLAALIAFAALAFAPLTPARAGDDAAIRVMTQNLYQGTNFREAIEATTPLEFLLAGTTIYNNILATKPSTERAAAVAREIAKERPDLVGLQEAAILRTSPFPPTDTANTVQSDQLRALIRELAKLGQRYEAVAIMPGFDPQAPTTIGLNSRVTVRIVIIARSDSMKSDLKFSNMQVQHYRANGSFPTTVGTFINTRGWASVDVTVRGRTVRFVTTHLEGEPPFSTQLAQANELLASAGNTTLPMIVVGDFNSTANDSSDASYPTYQRFLDAGFVDAWTKKHPWFPGLTCCQNQNVLNPVSELSSRVDLILYRGKFSVRDVELVGENPRDRTPSGLWPSDHAGVLATLEPEDTPTQ